MILRKLAFGGFGRRRVELAMAGLVITTLSAVIATSVAIIEGARTALHRFQRVERPDVVQVVGRFNRALFELPRSGDVPPATLPVYEPRIEPDELAEAAGRSTIVRRQSLLRNVVTEDAVSNVYIFGIDPDAERQVSRFEVATGRFLTQGDQHVAVLDTASAQALHVGLRDSFQVRTAAGTDLALTVVGILDALELAHPPLTTVLAPALRRDTPFVTSGVFVPLGTSEEIFARSTLTDALVVAKSPEDIPALTERIRQQFRLNAGVFVEESYSRYVRSVGDFRLTLVLFRWVVVLAALFACGVAGALFYDISLDRTHQFGVLAAIGLDPFHLFSIVVAPALIVGIAGAAMGFAVALVASPTDFQMPSLLAGLGPVTPTFDRTVLAVMTLVVLSAVTAGVGRTSWSLVQGPIARLLRRDES